MQPTAAWFTRSRTEPGLQVTAKSGHSGGRQRWRSRDQADSFLLPKSLPPNCRYRAGTLHQIQSSIPMMTFSWYYRHTLKMCTSNFNYHKGCKCSWSWDTNSIRKTMGLCRKKQYIILSLKIVGFVMALLFYLFNKKQNPSLPFLGMGKDLQTRSIIHWALMLTRTPTFPRCLIQKPDLCKCFRMWHVK
jgi:hypothetical protein